MRAILVCPNREIEARFVAAMEARGDVALPKILQSYPTPDALCRIVRAWVPDVVFLDITENGAELLARRLESEFPGVLRIALHPSQEPVVFRRVLDWRMNELLAPPFDSNEVERTINKLEQQLREKPSAIPSTDRLFAFLPAKAGVGASTIAANATLAFGEAGSRALLADFDMSSGVTGFMFDVDHGFYLADAAEHSRSLDEESWARMVYKLSNSVDLLLSGAPRLEETVSAGQMEDLVQFARRNYGVVNVDLPDSLNEGSLAVLREANRIFLVLTPELPAVKLARLKIMVFRKLELADKVRVLVNRVSPKVELSNSEIEKVIGMPIYSTFPCEYEDVTKAIRGGRAAVKLAPSVRDFVHKVLDKPAEKAKRPRFVDRLALATPRFGFR